jgi:hypothetical protein
VEITDKDRLDFLEKLSLSKKYQKVELIHQHEGYKDYYELFVDEFTLLGITGNSFRQAIDSAIMAQREKDK